MKCDHPSQFATRTVNPINQCCHCGRIVVCETYRKGSVVAGRGGAGRRWERAAARRAARRARGRRAPSAPRAAPPRRARTPARRDASAARRPRACPTDSPRPALCPTAAYTQIFVDDLDRLPTATRHASAQCLILLIILSW